MTDKAKSGLQLTATIVGWAVLLVGVLHWASTDRAGIVMTQESHAKSLSDHETRIRQMEHKYDRDVSKIKSDIEWIRDRLGEDGR